MALTVLPKKPYRLPPVVFKLEEVIQNQWLIGCLKLNNCQFISRRSADQKDEICSIPVRISGKFPSLQVLRQALVSRVNPLVCSHQLGKHRIDQPRCSFK